VHVSSLSSDRSAPDVVPPSFSLNMRAAGGLTTAQVAERRARGLTNVREAPPSRSVLQIARSNIFTRFNAILGAMLAIIVVVGPLQDAMFGGVIVVNTGIGIFQELRAKRALDRVAVVTQPSARVLRDGEVVTVATYDIVVDDVILLSPGDGIVVDGEIVEGAELEVDESLLTGESEAVEKPPASTVLSGSFVVGGTAFMRAVRVGAHAYGATVTAEARRFELVRSELRDGVNRLLRGITWVLVPTAALLAWSQLAHNHNFADAVRGSVAGTVTMVPEGLVLLTSIAFAVGVVRLARHKVVVSELPALEGLARVDVLCIDKTGTLTTGDLEIASFEPLIGVDPDDARVALAAIAACDPAPNATMSALGRGFTSAPGWTPTSRVAFSSARKFTEVDFGEHGRWLLGAPEVVLESVEVVQRSDLLARASSAAESGRRVLVLARAAAAPIAAADALVPAALVTLTDTKRDAAAETLAYLRRQDVRVIVLSGDHPATVQAVLAQLESGPKRPSVDARTLAGADEATVRNSLRTADIFGRVTPQQKKAMVQSLRGDGHVVAMVGDGINDITALKAADLGITFASGAAAARTVSRIVLLDDSFSHIPDVVAEGRRVIANVERVANLFLTKTVYATALALAVGVARLPFPFLPRHLTLVSSLTIGIPGFFLALAPNAERARPGFLSRVLRFAIPAGLVVAVATFVAYSMVRAEPGMTLASARTVATLVLAGVALWVLWILARPATRARQWLIATMVGLLLLALVIPWARDFFALTLPRPMLWLAGVGVAGLAGLTLEGGWLAAASIDPMVRRARERLVAAHLPFMHTERPRTSDD
jgi:cation-transporting ATPase E